MRGVKRLAWLLLLAIGHCQVTVTSEFSVGSSVKLTWVAATTGAAATSYDVLRGPVGGPYIKITQDGTVTQTIYIDSHVPKGQSCYVVRGVNANGTSGNSNESCIVAS